MKFNQRAPRSFTLIELLVVIAIVGLLAGLLLAAAGGVRGQAARSQAKTEIAALDGALTRFFTDQGFYPGSTGVLPTASLSPGNNIQGSQILFSNLMGRVFFTNTPAAGLRAYLEPKTGMVETKTTQARSTNYFIDPWGNAYGYYWSQNDADVSLSTSLMNKSVPDLWSTGGQNGTGKQTNRAKIICNWPN